MLTINRFVFPSPAQWDFVIEGMRNPKNSWDRSDSSIEHVTNFETLNSADFEFHMGTNDQKLALTLAKGGPVHAKYRRMLPVHIDVTAPLYWWKEFETYRIGVCPNPSDIEMNSCSTMHKIDAKSFTFEDFSRDHMNKTSLSLLEMTIMNLNAHREAYLGSGKKDKDAWWQLIQNLPSSYNQKRSLSMNYEVLANMYKWRRNHKLDEWHVLCDWIENKVPYSEIIMTNE